MKSLFLVLIFGIAMANAQNIGLDFINDNIIKPMLEGIYQNAVTAVVNGILSLFKPQGKRNVTFEDIQSTLNNFLDYVLNLLFPQGNVSQEFLAVLEQTSEFLSNNVFHAAHLGSVIAWFNGASQAFITFNETFGHHNDLDKYQLFLKFIKESLQNANQIANNNS